MPNAYRSPRRRSARRLTRRFPKSPGVQRRAQHLYLKPGGAPPAPPIQPDGAGWRTSQEQPNPRQESTVPSRGRRLCKPGYLPAARWRGPAFRRSGPPAFLPAVHPSHSRAGLHLPGSQARRSLGRIRLHEQKHRWEDEHHKMIRGVGKADEPNWAGSGRLYRNASALEDGSPGIWLVGPLRRHEL